MAIFYAAYGRTDSADSWDLIVASSSEIDTATRGGAWQDDRFDTSTGRAPEMLYTDSTDEELELYRNDDGDTFPRSLPANYWAHRLTLRRFDS